MAKRTKRILTEAELIQERLKRELSDIEEEIHLIPEPTYIYSM